MNDKKNLFIHIPKNAGNSIYRHLIELDFEIFKYDHLKLSEINNEIKLNLKIMAVIRNPYDRLVSFYSFYKSYNQKFIDLYNFLENKYKKNINQIDEKILLYYLKKLESLEWSDKFIEKNPKIVLKNLNKLKTIKTKKYNLNITFKEWLDNNLNKLIPQYKYLEDNNNNIDYLIKYENLNNDYNLFLKDYGIKSKLPKKNVSKHTHFLDYYNKDIFNMVKEYVKKDCEIYNYELF